MGNFDPSIQVLYAPISCGRRFIFRDISDNFTTMMSASTQTKRGLLYANDLENLSSVANIVSNVAAVIVDVAIRWRRARQQRTNHGSVPGRTFRQTQMTVSSRHL